MGHISNITTKLRSPLVFGPAIAGILGGTLAFAITFHVGPFINTAPTSTATPAPIETTAPVYLTAQDGTKIAAHIFAANQNSPYGMVISHQLGGSRADVETYAQQVVKTTGIAIIAIDLRGHGQSDGNWHNFSDSDYQKMPLDFLAADQYLRQNFGVQHMAYFGISISANAALRAAITAGNVEDLAMVSPGANYQGITTDDVIGRYHGNLLLAAAKDDQSSDQDTAKLKSEASLATTAQFFEFPTGGHGIALLANSALPQTIRDWLAVNLAHLAGVAPTPS